MSAPATAVFWRNVVFPPDPDFTEPDEVEFHQPPWWAAPEDELPALLPESELVAVTNYVAVALVGAFVYRDGVNLRVERSLRRHGLSFREWNELCATFMEQWPNDGPTHPQARLRCGLVLADSQRVVSDHRFSEAVTRA